MSARRRGRRGWLFGPVAVALFATLGASAAADTVGPDGWIRSSTEDGITVSHKDVPGSSFVAFRGEGVVDAPLLLVGSVLVDVTRSKEWVDSVVDSRVLRMITETEYVTYSHIGMPITFSDRDFVTDVTLSVDPAAKRLSIRMHSVDDASAPKTSYVRGQLSTPSSFTLTSVDGGARTLVVAEVHADPKGGIPAWIVNWFQNNWGHNTLMRLRKQVKKPDIAVHLRLKALLEDKGFFPPLSPSPSATPAP